MAQAVLALPPDTPWVLIDADASGPVWPRWAPASRAVSGSGMTLAAADLRAALDRLSAPPDGLPEDAVRRLGVVLVVGEVPSTTVGPIVERRRVVAAHYLRPTERDPQGHIQRRPPAVLATWVAETDTFDHFAWGMTPELADLVDRTQASFEELQASRAAALRAGCVATGRPEAPRRASRPIARGRAARDDRRRRTAVRRGRRPSAARSPTRTSTDARPIGAVGGRATRLRLGRRGAVVGSRQGRTPTPREDLMDQPATSSRPATLGALRASGYRPRSVKQELRANLMAALAADEPVFPGIVGYEQSVIPAIENAILAGQDFVLLGERGQAKTRLARSLVDAARRRPSRSSRAASSTRTRSRRSWPPPVSASRPRATTTPIEWLPRDRRYGEKLATPDITIADLIGEVDPIKVAEGRYLSDASTIAFGLIPRTNRGIFTLNELPDLAERIQVGLLNILEERDVQVRGHNLRLPLDLFFVASANPEDYTSRGRIITPLKDRLGSQIRTHYPADHRARAAASWTRSGRRFDDARPGHGRARLHARDRGRAVAPRAARLGGEPAVGGQRPGQHLQPRDAARQRRAAGRAPGRDRPRRPA